MGTVQTPLIGGQENSHDFLVRLLIMTQGAFSSASPRQHRYCHKFLQKNDLRQSTANPVNKLRRENCFWSDPKLASEVGVTVVESRTSAPHDDDPVVLPVLRLN